MRLIGTEILKAFSNRHADVASQINNWVSDVRNARWQNPMDIKERYRSASVLKGNIVIFNVKGNDYRLEVKIDYQREIVNVTWIGTHSEYDKRYK